MYIIKKMATQALNMRDDWFTCSALTKNFTLVTLLTAWIRTMTIR